MGSSEICGNFFCFKKLLFLDTIRHFTNFLDQALARFYTSSFILASELTSVNLLNSGAVTKLVVFKFVSRVALVAKLLISGILGSISIAFVLIVVLVARLIVSSILISISVAFVLRAAVVTKPVTRGTLLCLSVIFVL